MTAIRDWKIDDALEFHLLSKDPYFASRRLKQYLYPDTFLNTVTILETYRDADKQKFCIQAVTSQERVCGFIQFEKKNDYSGEISYWIGHEYWNQGIASCAVRQMCSRVFRQFPVFMIYARVEEKNIASQKVLLHNGFVCEEYADDIRVYHLYR